MSSDASFIFRQLIAGGAASIVVRTAEAPLERIKLLLQNQNMMPAHKRYRGIFDALVRVPREQGVSALWRGNLTNCIRVFPTYALRLTLMPYYQRKINTYYDVASSSNLPLNGQVLSGALSGATTCLLVYPLDLARTKVSADCSGKGAAQLYTGMLDCLAKTYKSNGIAGLYRGLFISLIEITPYTAIALGGYEFFKGRLQHIPTGKGGDSELGLAHTVNKLSAGWVSGLCASLFCYPMDTVKRQLMLDGSDGFKSRYSGSIVKCVSVLQAEGGIAAFYRGCLLNALKSAPACALTLVCNDAMKRLFNVE